MFARILEFVPLMEKKDEFIRVVKKEVLPILKKQEGFLEILPLVPENKTEKVWRSPSGPTRRSSSATSKSGSPGPSRFSNPIWPLPRCAGFTRWRPRSASTSKKR